MKYTIQPLQLSQVTDIYTQYLHRHFPADEIKPLKNIERMWDMGSYQALAMWSESSSKDASAAPSGLAGYAFFAAAPECRLILLDYFAILETCRGQGAGSLFLREMGKKLPEYKGILIETEDVNYARSESEIRTRQKRNAFYEKNGVLRTGIRSTVYGVHYAIWNLPLTGAVSDEECRQGLKDIYRIMVPGKKYEENVQFHDSANSSFV